MTCAACAARIEKRLNRLDGVDATVNLATERAAVAYDRGRVAVGDLVSAVEEAGYTATVHTAGVEPDHARHPGARLRLVWSSILTVPVAVLSMVPDTRFRGWEWVALGLATPVVFLCGAGFHRVALVQARHGAATMDTLVSIGTLAAWGWSATVLLAGLHEDTFFEAAAVITTLILLGRSLESGARSRSRAAMGALLASAGSEACLLRDGVETVVPSASLRVDDRFVVRPGEKVATDGVIVEGTSAVGQALLTGEPIPAEVGPGAEVVGGALNTYGMLVVSATRVGSETQIAQIARLVEEAQVGKAPIQHLADRISGVFVPIVMGLSVATLGVWLAIGEGAGSAFTAAVAVLIVACPCALGLATPTALAVGTARGAQLGILLRGPEVLEQARRITTVLLDKTGTLTEGHPELVEVIPALGEDRARALLLAGAVEAGSEHPVGRAIAKAARAELGQLPAVEQFRNLPGSGVSGLVDGLQVEVGQQDGIVTVSWDGAPRATFALSDPVKPGSASAVERFRALGVEPVLLTGDERGAAEAVAAVVGIDRVEAGIRPEGKLAEVTRRQAAGEVVAMIGDGINDAAALAAADLGIALGTGADVAKEASDMTLVSGDLGRAVDAVRLARRTLGTIRGNLGWAFVYNVAALPIAALGLLDPMIAAAAMAASSLCVVGNSLRLFRFRPVASID